MFTPRLNVGAGDRGDRAGKERNRPLGRYRIQRCIDAILKPRDLPALPASRPTTATPWTRVWW